MFEQVSELPPKQSRSFAEFVTLMALMMSLVALAIDTMLPALPDIGKDLGVLNVNDNQYILSFLFLGLSLGQIFYGPISDTIGRKPSVYIGLFIFVVGCLFSIFSMNFFWMLVGRFLQGIGLGAPRIVSMAMIRDRYAGNEMARVMSFIMMIFIMVPIVAPAVGQGILLIAHWRSIFVMFLVMSLVMLTWFYIRQEETLTAAQRKPFSLKRIALAFKEVFGHRQSLVYTVTAGLISGALLGYLNLAQPIFQVQYGLGVKFPLYFGALAASLGCAGFVNAKIVRRFGMRLLSTLAASTISLISILFCLVAVSYAGHPPLWSLMAYLSATFFCIGIIFGNLNSLAMEQLGHIAGVGSAVVGSIPTLVAVPLGAFIGSYYAGTIMPLVLGFTILGTLSVGLLYWVKKFVGDKKE